MPIPVFPNICRSLRQSVLPFRPIPLTEAKAVLVDAFKKAMATDKVKTWAKENYYLLSGKTGAESKAVFDALESNFAWTLWELGAATVNPETLGNSKTMNSDHRRTTRLVSKEIPALKHRTFCPLPGLLALICIDN